MASRVFVVVNLHCDVVDAIFFGDEADGPQVVVDLLREDLEVVSAWSVNVRLDLAFRWVQVDVERHRFANLKTLHVPEIWLFKNKYMKLLITLLWCENIVSFCEVVFE